MASSDGVLDRMVGTERVVMQMDVGVVERLSFVVEEDLDVEVERDGDDVRDQEPDGNQDDLRQQARPYGPDEVGDVAH